MILPAIKDVMSIRGKMKLTLKQFASRCDLDVSWINQVETKKIEHPDYLKIKKIWDMYEYEKYKEEKTAGELCIKKIISFEVNSPIEKVNEKMIDTGISRIPIFDKGDCIGMITSAIIFRLVGSDISKVKVVPEMLEIPPPIVDAKMPLQSLRGLLEFFEFVLVAKNGFIHGILVKEDLMKLLKK